MHSVPPILQTAFRPQRQLASPLRLCSPKRATKCGLAISKTGSGAMAGAHANRRSRSGFGKLLPTGHGRNASKIAACQETTPANFSAFERSAAQGKPNA